MAERRRGRFRTIRVRVTAIATLAVAVVLLVASVLLIARQQAGLIDQLDETLSAEADAIAESLDSGGTLQPQDDDDRIVVVAGPDEVFATTLGELDGSDDVDARSVAELGRDMLELGDDSGEVTFDGDQFRVASASFDAPDGSEGTVYVAASRDDVDESVAELRSSLLWIVPLAVLALLVIVWIVVGRTLRPVERIRAEVADIGVAELDRRVPEPPGDDEIARLAVTMNAMLERLERSVSRQQRFVADASHELRTPLTRMRAELEVDDNDPANADPAATRRSQLDEIVGLQQMLEDLLILARSDAGTPDRAAGPVDLDDIVLEELRSRPPTSVTIDASRVSAAQVVGDAGQLRRVVRNLVDNAARHGRSSVVIELAEVGTSAILTVTDDGPGIPPERRAEVFERFARLDESRTGDAGGAGLGLAIVHDIVSRHGGTIDVGEGPAGGARFVVTLPTDAQGVDGAAR